MLKKILLLLASPVLALTIRANTVALDFTGGTTILVANYNVGWAFSLSSAVLVTDLGLWDQGSNGLTQTHQVTIWENTSMTAVATAMVDNSGTFLASSVDGFRYVSVAPTLLAPGNYTISVFFDGTVSGDPVAVNASTITTASEVTYLGGRSAGSLASTFPPGDDLGSGANSYFGPNFQYTLTNHVAVPESGGTFALMLGSVGCLVLLRRLLPAAGR